jgi:O-methyltransferase involved in polyketide biosynthesis
MTATHLEGVANTSILTLRLRADEHAHPRCLFRDEKAVEWIGSLDWPTELDGWYSKHAQTGIAVRTRVFDDLVAKHLSQMDKPVVVELGCGFSSRYHRIGRGMVAGWVDLDLPAVIEARRSMDPETTEHQYLAGSALGTQWIEAARRKARSDILIVAEGLLMYFDEAQVLEFFSALRSAIPSAVLVFDTQGERMRRDLGHHTQRVSAPLKWAVPSPQALEALPLEILSVRSLFECYPERLGLGRFLRFVPSMRNMNLFVEARL